MGNVLTQFFRIPDRSSAPCYWRFVQELHAFHAGQRSRHAGGQTTRYFVKLGGHRQLGFVRESLRRLLQTVR
jgi:hypothetical protein